MTDLPDPVPPALPALVAVTAAFAERVPTQRIIDAVERVEGDRFGLVIQRQPFRVVAFRALMRDFPDYDLAALWLHAYDVEVDVTPADPTSPPLPTPEPHSNGTGASILTP